MAPHRPAPRRPPGPRKAPIACPGPTARSPRPSGGRHARPPPTASGVARWAGAGRRPRWPCSSQPRRGVTCGCWGAMGAIGKPYGGSWTPFWVLCPFKWPLDDQRTCWFAIWEANKHKSPYKLWLIRPLKPESGAPRVMRGLCVGYAGVMRKSESQLAAGTPGAPVPLTATWPRPPRAGNF